MSGLARRLGCVVLLGVACSAASAETCTTFWARDDDGNQSYTGGRYAWGAADADACERAVGSFPEGQWEPGACTISGGVMSFTYPGAGVVLQYRHEPAGCTATAAQPSTPPASGASAGTVPMDWSNASHLMQALLVASVCFSTFAGYRAGDKL